VFSAHRSLLGQSRKYQLERVAFADKLGHQASSAME
jgi:hypothetical protein